jgi:hypothetical protein
MLEYNLTQRERQIVIRLLDLSRHSKEKFEARMVDPAGQTGPAHEMARLDFGGEGQTMVVTKRDLRLLKDEGLIHFRWDVPGLGTGRLSSLAFDAVKNNFSSDADNSAALAAAASKLAVVADQKAIALRFAKITAELVNLTRQLIDADEAQAAEHEALSIAEELNKEICDESIVTRKTKGFVSRLSLTFSGTADLALKGEMIGEFAERLAAWLVALSIWTEWHAAHYPAPDPCA